MEDDWRVGTALVGDGSPLIIIKGDWVGDSVSVLAVDIVIDCDGVDVRDNPDPIIVAGIDDGRGLVDGEDPVESVAEFDGPNEFDGELAPDLDGDDPCSFWVGFNFNSNSNFHSISI